MGFCTIFVIPFSDVLIPYLNFKEINSVQIYKVMKKNVEIVLLWYKKKYHQCSLLIQYAELSCMFCMLSSSSLHILCPPLSPDASPIQSQMLCHCHHQETLMQTIEINSRSILFSGWVYLYGRLLHWELLQCPWRPYLLIPCYNQGKTLCYFKHFTSMFFTISTVNVLVSNGVLFFQRWKTESSKILFRCLFCPCSH